MKAQARRKCERCGTEYQPNGRQKYCTPCRTISTKHYKGDGKCLQCGKSFPIWDTRGQKYCSPDCWYASNRRLGLRKCTVCGIEFKPRREIQQCCSRECGAKSSNIERKRPLRICVVCGKEFDNKHHDSYACSKECRSKFRLDSLPEILCQRCNKPIKNEKNYYRIKTKYCSRECKDRPIGTKRVISNGGYIQIKLSNNKWMHEHRHVMEQKLGRPLLPSEKVHHKNGDRTDNRLENLELCSKPNGHTPGQRVSDLLVELKTHLISQGFNDFQIATITKEVNQVFKI